jgi:hypothetical protein
MGAKQIHDQYGKAVLQNAFGTHFDPKPIPFRFNLEDKHAGTARIDGTIDSEIAVEIESRASKQVRGALLDLAFHPLEKKLLVLINKYGNKMTSVQARVILDRLCRLGKYAVLELDGTGNDPKLEADTQKVLLAVKELRDS